MARRRTKTGRRVQAFTFVGVAVIVGGVFLGIVPLGVGALGRPAGRGGSTG